MNEDDKIADTYLQNIYDNVEFEPDGNIPPDFSINKNISVKI